MKISVVFYSSTGTIHALAEALAEGARGEGAQVRLRRVAETAPDSAIDGNPAWRAYVDGVAKSTEVALHDDLEWADAFAFGTPTRYGNVAAQLKQFIDTTGGLWAAGKLSNKPVTSFTSAMNAHGGQESTILALNNAFYHWGSILVPPGYTDTMLYASGGNPYGVSFGTSPDGNKPDDAALASARYQGKRLAEITSKLLQE